MKRLLSILWQLPQDIVGAVLWLICVHGSERETRKGVTVTINEGFPGGVSLGHFIFLNRSKEVDICHELGHCAQSRRWGWLYLPVVGFWSVFHLLCRRHGIIWNRGSDYYGVWPENQADELGGVKRDQYRNRYVVHIDPLAKQEVTKLYEY